MEKKTAQLASDVAVIQDQLSLLLQHFSIPSPDLRPHEADTHDGETHSSYVEADVTWCRVQE